MHVSLPSKSNKPIKTTTMKKYYAVYGILPKLYDGEIAGGDFESIASFVSMSRAFARAKKECLKPKWHEVEVRASDDDGELCGHWYFKKGQQILDMSV